MGIFFLWLGILWYLYFGAYMNWISNVHSMHMGRIWESINASNQHMLTHVPNGQIAGSPLWNISNSTTHSPENSASLSQPLASTLYSCLLVLVLSSEFSVNTASVTKYIHNRFFNPENLKYHKKPGLEEKVIWLCSLFSDRNPLWWVQHCRKLSPCLQNFSAMDTHFQLWLQDGKAMIFSMGLSCT